MDSIFLTQYSKQPLVLPEWANPYGLSYRFFAQSVETRAMLGEVPIWDQVPEYVKPVRLTDEIEKLLLQVGLVTNVDPHLYSDKTGKDPVQDWGDTAAQLVTYAHTGSQADVVMVMHRAATYASWAADLSFDLVIQPKRLHKTNDGSEISAVLTSASVRKLEQMNLNGKVLCVRDPFVATGSSIEVLLLALKEFNHLPKMVEVESMFATQQGCEALYHLASELEIPLVIRCVMVMNRMTKMGYLVYSSAQSLGLRLVEKMKLEFGQVAIPEENQAAGDAGDRFEQYLQQKWGDVKFTQRLMSLGEV